MEQSDKLLQVWLQFWKFGF